MFPITLLTPDELALHLARRARELRLAHERTQADVAAAAGVPLPTLRRFERTGEIGVVALLRIATALGATEAFADLFAPPPARSIDEAVARARPRQRGRRA